MQIEQGRAWEALERADSAMVTARRAMTNGADAAPAVQALARAATDLTKLLGVTAPDSATVAPGASAIASPAPRTPTPVTKPVTDKAGADRRHTPDDAVPDDITTNADAPERHAEPVPPEIGPREVIDTDTVRVERLPSRRDDNRSKMVLAGHGDTTRLVGFLEPQGFQQKKWDAFTPGHTRLDGGPFRTRQEALLRLLRAHVPVKTQRGRRR